MKCQVIFMNKSNLGETAALRSEANSLPGFWLDKSILKEVNPEYSLNGRTLKLKLQSFGHLMGRADSLEKTLRLGKVEGKKRRELASVIRGEREQQAEGITNIER